MSRGLSFTALPSRSKDKFPEEQQGRPRRPRVVAVPPLRCCSSSAGPASSSSSCSADEPNNPVADLLKREYKWGFVSDVESFSIPKGLSQDTVRLISHIRQEPPWLLHFRLRAYNQWLSLHIPSWPHIRHPYIDFQDISYYSQPQKQPQKKSLDEVDPSILLAYQKLGIPLSEQHRLQGIAIDAVFDSTSVAVTHHEELLQQGVIFCSISDAVRDYPDLVQKYLGRVVPPADNFYAALNSAVFSDGSFVYIPKGKKLEMPLSTYFRINAVETGQFERTLIVVDKGGSVEYLEGCTAPAYDKNQLHAAVVELFCAEGAQIKYSTVQNWYAGDKQGRGGIYNFVTKRGLCDGYESKISWTQVETGSAITWKYPSVVLKGDKSVGEFYSVALTNNRQQADTGTKMIHVGKETRSRIVSKGISSGESSNTYRGLVQIRSTSRNAKNYSQCDSLLIGDRGAANTYPYIQVKEPTGRVEHEASTSKISVDQLFYFQQRGIDKEKAVASIIGGFCGEVFKELPQEFAQEVNHLMNFKLEGSVG